MSLPAIDFVTIATTAKAALATYGTSAEFIEQGQTSGRTIMVVIYREGGYSMQLINDADSSDAMAILNPDDFVSPYRMPQKFDQLRLNVAGFVRTYTMQMDPAPILAAESLPLLLVRLRVN